MSSRFIILAIFFLCNFILTGNAESILVPVHLYRLINHGHVHFTDYQIYLSRPLITHFQLSLLHPSLGPLLSLLAEHMQNKIDHFSSSLAFLLYPSIPSTHIRNPQFPLIILMNFFLSPKLKTWILLCYLLLYP